MKILGTDWPDWHYAIVSSIRTNTADCWFFALTIRLFTHSILCTMGKRAYINVASNKYRPGTEKLIRLNSHIAAGHLPGSDDMRFTLEEDEDDASESVSSLNGVYNNFNVESGCS